MLDFTKQMIAFRRGHRAFLRRRFFTGRPVRREEGSSLPDVAWFTPDGAAMTQDDWNTEFGKSVTLYVNGEGIRERGPRGEKHSDSSFLLCFNAQDDWLEFATPPGEYAPNWTRVIDTSQPTLDESVHVDASSSLWIPDRSLVVLEHKW
jgi:isoamylase